MAQTHLKIRPIRLHATTRRGLQAKDTWFPHFHVVWFFTESFGYEHMLEFALQVADLWAIYSNQCGASGTRAANQFHDKIDSNTEKQTAQYLFKHGFLDLSFEPATVDLTKHSLSPFHLLAYTFYVGDADLLDQWEDFEQATSGTRRIVLSPKIAYEALKVTG